MAGSEVSPGSWGAEMSGTQGPTLEAQAPGATKYTNASTAVYTM